MKTLVSFLILINFVCAQELHRDSAPPLLTLFTETRLVNIIPKYMSETRSKLEGEKIDPDNVRAYVYEVKIDVKTEHENLIWDKPFGVIFTLPDWSITTIVLNRERIPISVQLHTFFFQLPKSKKRLGKN
ncbi:MAG: hypothetical protein KJ666_09140 [Bacteroidetes bacterium]|nr:hypothetical protein [Bacteroidota bacterium]MBU2585025.1 hypothetical protein [Bacteroidota bacterium]